MAIPDSGKRPKRKSRGRGLRTTTGCLTCKRRHIKCNEAHPICGPCAIGNRSCVYKSEADTQLVAPECLPDGIADQNPEYVSNALPQLSLLHSTQCPQPTRQASPRSNKSAVSIEEQGTVVSPILSNKNAQSGARNSPERNTGPLRPTHAADDSGREWQQACRNESPLLHRSHSYPRTIIEQEKPLNLPCPQQSTIERERVSQPRLIPYVPIDRVSSWVLENSIILSDLEHSLFEHYVNVLGKRLDFYDPEMHFTTTIPHRALRNKGLMKALLALSALHVSLGRTQTEIPAGAFAAKDPITNNLDINRNLAVKFYAESLLLINEAMKFPPFTGLDLVATAILISTYEMIDENYQKWGKHLRGLLWTQKFQNIDGESTGLGKAVWWTWLQQDIWLAMRERRRVYSDWSPKTPVSALTAPELVTHALYLLSKCVNYASDEESQGELGQRATQGTKLLKLLQEWREALPLEYNPLPYASNDEIFPSIWIHPPMYAAALQLQNLGLILVILHYPSSRAIDALGDRRHALNASVKTICGIARSVDAENEGANMISLNCLYKAAMCVDDPREQFTILDLLETCQKRIQWPTTSLRKEVELGYLRHALYDPVI